MLAQYSVRKPYTIVVAIMIIVLGIISYNNMTTVCFGHELPYVVVVTAYPGPVRKSRPNSCRPLEAVLGTSTA